MRADFVPGAPKGRAERSEMPAEPRTSDDASSCSVCGRSSKGASVSFDHSALLITFFFFLFF